MKQQILSEIETHKKLLSELESNAVNTIVKFAETISDCIKNNGCLYLCGNGGSAADCQHIAGEIVGRFRCERNGLPAIALSTDSSVITSVGNDYGFEEIFSRQVEALVKSDDVLWVLSTSGSSANIITAAKKAKQKGAKVIAFTGRIGSDLGKICDLCLYVNTEYASSAQEIHQLAYHIICKLIEQNCYKD